MKLKKTLITVLAMLMVFSAMHLSVFAETDETRLFPNFSGQVDLDNWECKEFESLEALAELPLTVTIASETDAAVFVEFEMVYDDMGGYTVQAYDGSPEMEAIMAGILENQTAVTEAFINNEITEDEYYAAVFEGYTVTLNLGEDAHWHTDIFDGGVYTSEDMVAQFDITVMITLDLYNALAEMAGLEPIVLDEESKPQTYEEFALFLAEQSNGKDYESYEDALRDPINGNDEETIQEALATIAEQDAILAAARANTYPGQLYIMLTLVCDCPVSYQVGHYYAVEKDGELDLVELIWEGQPDDWGDYYLEGEKDAVIKAEDYVKPEYAGSNAEYAGKAFEYVGCYDSWVIGEDDWEGWEIEGEQFALGDFEYDGMVLLYVFDEAAEPEQKPEEPVEPEQKPEEPAPAPEQKPVDVEDGDAKPAVDEDVKDTVKDDSKADAPKTGDYTPIGLYVALFATAVIAIVVLFVLKKRVNKDKE